MIGGDYFLFFSPVFNIADSAIFIGVASILLFQKKFFHVIETEISTIEPSSPVGPSFELPSLNENGLPKEEPPSEQQQSSGLQPPTSNL